MWLTERWRWNLFERHEVDLAIVDLNMPVFSGLDFIKECRQRRPEIQYVVLTAYESFEYIQQALEAGGSGLYIQTADG